MGEHPRVKALSKNSLERNDGSKKGVGGAWRYPNRRDCLALLPGDARQRLRKYHHSCDKRGQEKPCLTKVMHFLSSMESLSKWSVGAKLLN